MKNMKHIMMLLVAVAVAGVIFVGARRYMHNEGIFAKKDNVTIQNASNSQNRRGVGGVTSGGVMTQSSSYSWTGPYLSTAKK